MFDPAVLSALATTTVSLLAPLFNKAIEKGAEEVGKTAVGAALDGLKKRLTHAGAKEAMEDLALEPCSTAAQGALEMQLRKALQADPDLPVFLQEWIAKSPQEARGSQVATVTGENNKVVQIAGTGNTVN